MPAEDVLRNALTPEQFRAATDESNEILCLACAGSGKSRTLAYRIARLLAQGESPDSIVAFTFTEKAADSIKRRVSEALEATELDPTMLGAMYIGTIHSYCQSLLGEMDAMQRQFDVLDENRLKLYLISRYPQLGLHNLKRLKGSRYFNTIDETATAWKTFNDEILDLKTVTEECPTMGAILARIEEGLSHDQYVDFSLMIRKVVEALRAGNPSMELAIAPLRHLMVDEYQDINPSQEELIRLLHDRGTSLFVVGDDDQSIYGWRGADVQNILTFRERYPGCTSHELSTNFRSTEAIVATSNAFAQHQLGPLRIPKTPTHHRNISPQDLGVLWFPDRNAEADWVANRIGHLLGKEFEDGDGTRGLTPADFAILMRSTRINEQDDLPRHNRFTSALRDVGIPFSLETGGGPFERPQTAVLRSSFELLRSDPPTRDELRHFFDESVRPAFPNAHFKPLAEILARWNRDIHRPRGGPRVRLYPQKLFYELLEAFGLSGTNFTDDVMRDIGLFSKMLLDVETVYMSVDSEHRFSEVLNFLQNVAEHGYDVSTDDMVQRPDAVTISTVHKMKGLEFPCVFIVDVESQRFPRNKSRYSGWLPPLVMANAISRGAYQGTPEEEVRLFYTAMTRAERYLYITGAARLPGGRRVANPSIFSQLLLQQKRAEISTNPADTPCGMVDARPRRRIEDADYPTSFTEVKDYLKCPRSYQFRSRYGFNPHVPELFGFGRTVHACIEKLHEQHPAEPPLLEDVDEIVSRSFHLKHVPQSNDLVEHPGPYERAKDRAVAIARDYVANFGGDFTRRRQVEVVFEIPAAQCVISGSIDLILQEDAQGAITEAEIVDFKTVEGGEDPTENNTLDWVELSLQVQLYARAAENILGGNSRTGSVHFLRDNQRVEVPIDQEAVDAALGNIEWAVDGILAHDFPMRPHPDKCEKCDFCSICPKHYQDFVRRNPFPPEIHLPSGGSVLAGCFSLLAGE